MSMKFEAAIITKKRTGEDFNTDSVNINGKILPREIIAEGYKGAGEEDCILCNRCRSAGTVHQYVQEGKEGCCYPQGEY